MFCAAACDAGLPASVTSACGASCDSCESSMKCDACVTPRRMAGVSTGAFQYRSISSSVHVRVSEIPPMSIDVVSSPTSQSTISTPAWPSRRATAPYVTNSSSYVVEPRPLSSAMTRLPASSGLSFSRPSTSSCATSSAVPRGAS